MQNITALKTMPARSSTRPKRKATASVPSAPPPCAPWKVHLPPKNYLEACRKGWTNLFIHPPYEFNIADSLVTNFHLPKTSLLIMTCAFAGYDLAMEAYKKAIKDKYRFFSYGDAMLVV